MQRDRYAVSQEKQNELWKPEPFNVGVHYALTLKSVALGLVYGPLWPPAYLLTSVGLALSWICTRFGLRHWYRSPANVDADMMMHFRYRLALVLAFAIAMQTRPSCQYFGIASAIIFARRCEFSLIAQICVSRWVDVAFVSTTFFPPSSETPLTHAT